jgi:hypothetical protein
MIGKLLQDLLNSLQAFFVLLMLIKFLSSSTQSRANEVVVDVVLTKIDLKRDASLVGNSILTMIAD